MATISNTPRPAYAWDSTDNVWYPIGTGAHSHNEIDKTTINAKGDLIVGTANDAYTRQGVGADGSVLVADSTQTTGVNWAGPSNVAGKNLVINGGMDFWQRGTSFTSLGNVYTADRWNVYNTGTGGAITASRVSSWLDGFNYAYRLQRNSGSTSTGPTYLSMAFEGADFVRLTGKTATFSFYARKGADYSPTSSNWNVYLEIGTNTDGFLYAGLTGGIAAISQDAVLTTSGTRYSYTFNVPTGYRAARLQMSMTPTGTAGTNDWMEITGVQLEVGSVATLFSRAGGTLTGELAACQRYYSTSIPDGYTTTNFPINQQGQSGCVFYNNTGNDLWGNLMFPVRMRTAPTLTLYSQSNRTAGSLRDSNTGSDVAIASYAPYTGNSSNVTYMTATGLTSGRFYTGQWTASAEL